MVRKETEVDFSRGQGEHEIEAGPKAPPEKKVENARKAPTTMKRGGNLRSGERKIEGLVGCCRYSGR